MAATPSSPHPPLADGLPPIGARPPADRPVVLITGAARRIGRAMAEHLATRGWAVALHHRQSSAEAQALAAQVTARGALAHPFAADLSHEDQTLALAHAVVAHFGRWDALINNASLFEYDAVDTLSFDTLDRHWRANTAAPVVLTRELHRHLRTRPGARGCAINLLDQKLWNPNPDYLSYTLSKAALESATTLLAQALAPELRVCGLAPGVTLISGPQMTQAGFEQAHALTPLGRSSTPEDLAQAAAFLLQAPAITGTTLLVDGGQHLSAQPRDVLFLTPQGPSSP